MQSQSLAKSKTVNVTVRLEDADRARIKLLAEFKKRTPHYIMLEEITKYLKEVMEQRFMILMKSATSW